MTENRPLFRSQRGTISAAELAKLLGGGQTDRVAFLSATAAQPAIAETLAALANANGGLVVLGVSAKGAAQKISDLPALREAVVQAGLLTDPPLISAHTARGGRRKGPPHRRAGACRLAAYL